MAYNVDATGVAGKSGKSTKEENHMTRLSVGIFAFALSISSAYANGGGLTELKSQLQEALTLTKVDTRGEVREGGKVYQVKIPGLRAEQGSSMTMAINYVENGQLRKSDGGKGVGKKFGNFIGDVGNVGRQNGTFLKEGERVYVTKLDVKEDHIDLTLNSVEEREKVRRGNTTELFVHAFVSFKFADGVASAKPEDLLNAIYGVIAPEAGQPAVLAPQSLKPEPTVPAVAKAPEAQPAKSSFVGMSADELKAKLGNPSERLEVGSQVIYIYSGLGVRFTIRDGVVVGQQ
jgi:hypothetical protein